MTPATWLNAARTVLLFACCTAAQAGDAQQWRDLILQAPTLPASLAEARSGIAVRRVEGGVVVETADPVWRQRRDTAEALLAPVAAASASQVQARLAAIENDPQMALLSRGVEAALRDAEQAMRRGERPSLRASDPQVDRLLQDMQAPPDLSRLPPIAAYRLESMRLQPSAAGLRRQMAELRRSHAREHAALDAVPAATAEARIDLVQRHRELAQRHMQYARSMYTAAREAMAPRVEKMAALAQDAEARGAQAAERVQAYQWFKGVLRFLDDLCIQMIEDAGFWASIEPAASQRYALAGAADADLRADGVPPPGLRPYPHGRMPTPLDGR